MTNRQLLEFTLKVNIGTCNEIYTKIDRQLEERSDIDLALVKYFNTLENKEKTNYDQFEAYFIKFYDFCFDQSCKNMLKELNNFKY